MPFLNRAMPGLIAAAVLLCATARAQPQPAPDAATPDAAAPAPAAAVESVNDQALFLGGLPVPEGSPLAALEQQKDWQDYARQMAEDWKTAKGRRLEKMAAWTESELKPKIDPKANLFYFFGGPDGLSVSVLYPEAPVYILCGLEPIGKVPPLAGLKPAALGKALTNLRASIRPIVRSSFFRTNEMAGDLTRTDLRGVLPLLYFFVARADARLIDVKLIELDDAGEVKELADGETPSKGVPGARLRIKRAGADKEQEIYYLRQNVENDILKNTPGFLAFHKKYAPANSFLKAASFILHNAKRFSVTRDFIVENSLSVLQDDSGLPFHMLQKKTWNFVLYGKYLRPLPPFGGHLQDDLVKAFATEPVQPLPFTTGYRHAGESNLVLALRKPPETRPVEPAAPADEKCEPAK